MDPSDIVKVVVVGDGECDATDLLFAFTHNNPATQNPSVFSDYAATIIVYGRSFDLALLDLTGENRLRQHSYHSTDVILLCFSVGSRCSLDNARKKLLPEIQQFSPNVPFLLVGTNSDLRKDSTCGSSQELVDPNVCRSVAVKMGAWSYLECSAKTWERVDEVFEKAVLAAAGECSKFLRECVCFGVYHFVLV